MTFMEIICPKCNRGGGLRYIIGGKGYPAWICDRVVDGAACGGFFEDKSKPKVRQRKIESVGSFRKKRRVRRLTSPDKENDK